MKQYSNQLDALSDVFAVAVNPDVRPLSAAEIELVGGGTTVIDEYPLPRR